MQTVPSCTGDSLAACAEASFGAEGGTGPLVYLQRGLQNAVSQSSKLREILIAGVYRSVRLRAGVDYSGDDGSNGTGEVSVAAWTRFGLCHEVLRDLTVWFLALLLAVVGRRHRRICGERLGPAE